MPPVNLRELERVEVTILVDNYTDLLLLQSTPVVKRPPVLPPNAFLAEHGFSCLIKTVDVEEHLFLMDVGISGICLLHNAQLLKSDLSKVEAIILSHGHFDHCWALREILPKIPKGIPIVLHPDAFLRRRFNLPALKIEVPMPSPPDENFLREAGMEVRKIREDSTLASGRLLVLGEIDRITEFEKGMPGMEAEINGQWVKDPFPDDRGVAVKVKNKGLVVIGGCSHAGIINTVKHAQKVTGAPKVHAVLGGFHLTGPMMEPIIAPTIGEMKKFGMDYIVPTHCTGWRAINQFAKEMSEQFILNTVGTTYIFA
jgi:7,8-dihydropterin-6-yl-methyl-4-(beta-D-ribofuranosyl)aminobenzene 5'-phosphate synthase